MKFMLVESITEKIDRLHYKESDKPFYDAIRDILQYRWKDELFETFHNSEYLYQTPVPKLIGDDRISLSDLKINNIADIGQVARLFRDTRIESFKLLAVKGDGIVGYMGVSLRVPGRTTTVPFNYRANDSIESVLTKRDYKYNVWLDRICADGYFLIHNHPTNDVRPSNEDIEQTQDFIRFIPGFLGHIIVGIDKYAFIDESLNYIMYSYEDVQIPTDKFDATENKITSPNRACRIAKDFIEDNDRFLVLYVNNDSRLAGVEEFPNKAIQSSDFKGYIRNQKVINGAAHAILYTNSREVYMHATPFVYRGVFSDCILDVNNRWIDWNEFEKSTNASDEDKAQMIKAYKQFNKR